MLEKTVLGLIETLYGAASDPKLWPVFLDGFGAAVSGNIVGFVVQDFQNSNAQLTLTNVDPSAIESYENYYASRNPWVKRSPHFFTVDNVQNGLESCPPEIVQKSEWFNDWGRPNDMFHSFGGTLQREGSLACFITAMRPRTSDPFADEQLDLLRLLMPHLKRALELQQRLARLAATETGLDFFPTGVFVVDGHATPRYWNRAAQQILDSRNGLYVLGGHLQAASGEPNKQLRALLHGALHKSLHCQPGEPLQIPRLDKRPLILQAFPLPSAVPVFQGWLPGALLFVTDPDNLPEPQANLVAKLFHLTPAESEVAVALASGRSIDDISNELSISRNTARCHVQKIFQKTGVSRQGQLIRLLMQSGVVDIRP